MELDRREVGSEYRSGHTPFGHELSRTKGISVTRPETGRDGKKRLGTTERKVCEEVRYDVRRRNWMEEKTSRSLTKLTCMWDDDVFSEIQTSAREMIVGNQLDKAVQRMMKTKPIWRCS